MSNGDAQHGGDGQHEKWSHRFETETGHGSIDSGGLYADLPSDGEYDVAVIGPSRGMVSVSTTLKDEDLETYVTARISPDQARDMADSLRLAADQAEEELA